MRQQFDPKFYQIVVKFAENSDIFTGIVAKEMADSESFDVIPQISSSLEYNPSKSSIKCQND